MVAQWVVLFPYSIKVESLSAAPTSVGVIFPALFEQVSFYNL